MSKSRHLNFFHFCNHFVIHNNDLTSLGLGLKIASSQIFSAYISIPIFFLLFLYMTIPVCTKMYVYNIELVINGIEVR
jgi:hypothetical protein